MLNLPHSHACEGQPEKALIAHPWRQDSDGGWVRDDCVECGVAYAACISRTLDGKQWTGPGAGPYSDGQFHDTIEDAKIAYDVHLMKKGWTIL